MVECNVVELVDELVEDVVSETDVLEDTVAVEEVENAEVFAVALLDCVGMFVVLVPE